MDRFIFNEYFIDFFILKKIGSRTKNFWFPTFDCFLQFFICSYISRGDYPNYLYLILINNFDKLNIQNAIIFFIAAYYLVFILFLWVLNSEILIWNARILFIKAIMELTRMGSKLNSIECFITIRIEFYNLIQSE